MDRYNIYNAQREIVWKNIWNIISFEENVICFKKKKIFYMSIVRSAGKVNYSPFTEKKLWKNDVRKSDRLIDNKYLQSVKLK
jgi:hypothetical protein